MKEGKNPIAEQREQKGPIPSREQDTVICIIRATAHVREFGLRVFEEVGITPQQYNVLRILRGAGPGGLPTLDIAQRMIEKTPGITRLLDRLEAKRLVRRERPSGDRRQVICYVTKAGLDVVQDLDAPLKKQASEALGMLSESELEQLSRLLGKVIGVN
jgi:DNA-binding MarR family transcriptional regulator